MFNSNCSVIATKSHRIFFFLAFVSLLANTSISLSFPQIHRRVRRQDLILDGNQDWCAAQVVAEPCENGGVCRSQTSGYTCDCIDGYWGFRCEFDPNFNPCESSGNPCMNNGICVPDKEAQRAEDNNVVQGPFLCVCKKGYGGRV